MNRFVPKFSLRTVCLAMIALSIVFAAVAFLTHGFREEYRLATKLMGDYGATVSRYHYGDCDFTITQAMPITGPWAYSFGRLYLGVRSIHFRDATIDDEAWDTLAAMERPTILIFENCEFETTGKTFSRLPYLEKVHFDHTNVSDEQIKELLTRPYLFDLRFKGGNDEVLNWIESIVKLPRLQVLHITGHSISDEQLELILRHHWWGLSLADCQFDYSALNTIPPTEIGSLDVSNTSADDAFLQQFSFYSLGNIDLSNTKVGDESLVQLRDLEVLGLNLKNTQISDAGVDALSTMTFRYLIDVDGTRMTQQALTELSKHPIKEVRYRNMSEDVRSRNMLEGAIRAHLKRAANRPPQPPREL